MFRSTVPALLLALAGCGGDPAAAKSPDHPAGAAAPRPATDELVPIDGATAPQVAQAELGKTLFFDGRLSGTGKMSCSTCHLPDHAWTDGKKTSPKFDGSANTRNTPTMYNVGSLERLYWDGRAPSLEKNVLAAWKGQMGGDPEAVAKVLAANADYRARFSKAALGEPTADAVVTALCAFLRTLNSANSAFDEWRGGKTSAITADAQKGYELFLSKAGCVVCHQEPQFTDRKFHGAGIGMDAAKPDVGAGGEKALNDPKLVGWFKTPTLREVAATPPYFHDGSVDKLEDAVRLMAAGGKEHPTRSPELTNRNLSDAEIGQLVAFLRTLTSSVPFTPPEVPK